MATLNVKNFSDVLHRKLKSQARRHGRTVASEVEAILAEQLIRLHRDSMGVYRDDRKSVTIRPRGRGKVKLTSIAELKETVRLLRSPKNVARVQAALQRVAARKRAPGSGSPPTSSSAPSGPASPRP